MTDTQGSMTGAGQLSLGQTRVRARFNPSGDDLVDEIKTKTAELIDLCHRCGKYDSSSGRIDDTQHEMNRLWALAMTHYEDAAMWAVKAATTLK